MMIKAQWMRGGTSKCWVFEGEELRSSGYSADVVLPRIFGSPDPRQLDGVGGATSTTSKAMIVERSDDPDIDVRFTFAQVGIEEAKVDWGSNCGNCSAAVGLYAIERGWVRPTGDVTEVRTLNTNTGQVIVQTLRTPGSRIAENPEDSIPGVVFPGHNVSLGFLSPEGRTTGKLLPTGAARESLVLRDGRDVTVTMLDAGAPVVLVAAESLGFAADSYDRWMERAEQQAEVLDEIRRAAAVAMGLAPAPELAERAIPKIGIASRSLDQTADLQILMMSMGKPHPAMPITGSVGVTIAAQTPGTVVADALTSPVVNELRIRIPVGTLSTFTEQTSLGNTVGVHRTARTLAEASLPLPERQLAEASLAHTQEVAS
ncbi:hypothetical protein K8P10_000755 [Leucobacter sp. Psy1]|nr:PrpF domain-containing protein [Leucobacter sp. Psy1]UBH05244.1 hypothetical protein K8P10_000755 [Leucobacter sp. Psy1]